MTALLVAPTDLPRVSARWYYGVRVTDLRDHPRIVALTFRLIVRTAKGTRTLAYRVESR